ncbi:hypothetical protein RCC89_16465 [Cytophagaceae bacterium ABcell3]|nr:hypothetical protein RCC89_16465 [Cytophagaceae bacterium ABcell3]
MKLFDNYLNSISDIVSENRVQNYANFSGTSQVSKYAKAMLNESFLTSKSITSNKVLIEFDKNQLTTLFGLNPFSFSETKIGSHPDFQHLQYHEFENHYCVSMFMDIKGSTRLNEKYSLFQIRKIKDTILTLAIHVASHFGGHVHRLQGDGIFLQFVRKGQSEQDAVINALNTATILTHFISSDLAEIFHSTGVQPLRVRIGIDIGYKDDVLWSHYGIPGCSELTTTSLHTDLAAKLQAKAKSNGILVGSNVKEILDIKDEFCQTCYDNNEKQDYYIYQGFKNYRKFNFNWENYLNSFDFVKKKFNRIEIEEPRIRIKCKVKNCENGEVKVYFQNSNAIKKGSDIEFSLAENEHLYFRKDWEKIEWKAVNSGKEARDANELTHDFGGIYKNKTTCLTRAGYVGHHYVECVIKRNHSDNLRIRFPIFVK